ncbi:MAG: hypothetical protein BZY80_00395 [SAR202 cluster bacterium Io17-Chloro-G2]|nr:MAG: hypothetical protein BZY80_00395 [SAR202 cluster bacterium Io17-Chloro-G2]
MTTESRLNIPLGEAMFTQRAIRRFRPDPIPDDVLRDIMEAAIRAPNGGNNQPWHFLVIKDPDIRLELGELYREAWWAKRKDEGINGPEDIAPGKSSQRSAMRLSSEFASAPVVVMVCALAKTQGAMGSVIPAVQNLLLAARSHGVGGTITTLHAQVDERVRRLFGVPDTAQIVYCLPLGYPRGRFGSVQRKPLEEVCSVDRWGDAIS